LALYAKGACQAEINTRFILAKRDAVEPFLRDGFGNPSPSHVDGRQLEENADCLQPRTAARQYAAGLCSVQT